MARRISAFFSSKDEDLPKPSGSPYNSAPGSPVGPSKGKLTKQMGKSSSDLNLNRMARDLEPPPVFTDQGMAARPQSRDGRGSVRSDTAGSRQSSSSRPSTPNMLGVPGAASPVQTSPSSGKLSKRRSWIPGRSDKQHTGSEVEHSPAQAWIAGLREMVPYDITKLLNGDPVDDLWDENGDVLVYIYPQGSRKGPSFRVSSQLFADSRALSYLTQPIQPTEQGYTNGHRQAPSLELDLPGPMGGMSLSDRSSFDRPPSSNGTGYSRPTYKMSDSQVKSVHLPLGLEGNFTVPGAIPRGDDLELVVLYRNFFAFLCGGALIATPRQNTLYAIFMSISSILRRLQYGNEKDSSWGAIPWASFSRYTDELRLGDVRTSREKNIEAILLGIAMKSWPLYAEGFTHAVGRLDDIKSIGSPKFEKIPSGVISKLERANHDLINSRLLQLHSKLDNFYFPSMFSGVANSTTATEAKLVRFKAWKAYFMEFRAYTITQYKRRYGSWPPKASSKKNSFEESGLNRVLIREVYKDFTDLYEMLVDRTSMTTRTVDMPTLADDAESDSNETIQHALRAVESEYDRSVPPVSPPIPFDVPQIPAFGRLMLAKDTQNSKKLRDDELIDLLMNSYNKDSIRPTPWIQEYIEYETKLCSGKTISEIIDIRCGQWLFMYAVLQALPMTVVDARDLQHTEGVEYFLCEGPRGGRPWMATDDSSSRAWYNVASGGGLVSMPADTIDHSVEGIYRRSHCWTIANTWAQALGPMSPVHDVPPRNMLSVYDGAGSPFLAPQPQVASRGPSPRNSPLLAPLGDRELGGLPRISSRSSMQLGLQEVAPPAAHSRPTSTYNPSITFDNILASNQIPQKGGKKGKK